MGIYSYFATAAKGLQEPLAAELIKLGVHSIRAERGGVHFQGSRSDGYRCCLWLRSASRILQTLAEFNCPTDMDLYNAITDIAWEKYITPKMTLAVDANLRESKLNHSHYVALKAKDAIVDRLRDRLGNRPDIDPRNPDIRINVHIVRNEGTVSLDLSGNPLHRRGYRQNTLLAPLRETLAAGIILMSGWNGTVPFIDPMCGSGTFPIEAALLASSTAPGLFTPTFSFQKWPDFDSQAWEEMLKHAQTAKHCLPHGLVNGSDRDFRAINVARKNALNLPIAKNIHWQNQTFANLKPPAESGILVSNPPYGTRLGEGEKLTSFYAMFGDILKKNWKGWTAWILVGNLSLAKQIGLRPSRRIVLYNGPIECRLLKFEIY